MIVGAEPPCLCKSNGPILSSPNFPITNSVTALEKKRGRSGEGEDSSCIFIFDLRMEPIFQINMYVRYAVR